MPPMLPMPPMPPMPPTAMAGAPSHMAPPMPYPGAVPGGLYHYTAVYPQYPQYYPQQPVLPAPYAYCPNAMSSSGPPPGQVMPPAHAARAPNPMYTHLPPRPLFPASAAAIAHEDPARAALRGSLAVPAACQTAVNGLLEDHAVMTSS
jgi:hypothetical protein